MVVSVADDTHLTVLGAMNVSGALYRRGGVAPRALLSALRGTSLYLTTRSIDLGDTIVDIPASARQLPMQVNLDANTLPPGIIDVSDPSTRYYAITDPVYSSSGGVVRHRLLSVSRRRGLLRHHHYGANDHRHERRHQRCGGCCDVHGHGDGDGPLVVGTGTQFTSEVAVGDYVMMQNSTRARAWSPSRTTRT